MGEKFDISEIAIPVEVIRETFSLLSRRNVPILIIAGIDWMEGRSYSPRALYRAKHEIIVSDVAEKLRYRSHRKEVYGRRERQAEKEYFRGLDHSPPFYNIGKRTLYRDKHTSIIHFANGQKCTSFQPENPGRHMHIYGQCTVMGEWVADEETFPSQLQKRLREDADFSDIAVDNRGISTLDPVRHLNNFILDAPAFTEGDIVVLYEIFPEVWEALQRAGCQVFDLRAQWPDNEISRSCWVDTPAHMGPAGLEQTAELVYRWLKESGMKTSAADISDPGSYRLFREFLAEAAADSNLRKPVQEYVDGILGEVPAQLRNAERRGAIVMNADPFTLGHRYLVEYAASEVDLLFVFCASADTSFFSAEDRMNMVKLGTEDLPNVVAASSGRIFANAETFPEYHIPEVEYDRQELGAKDIHLFTSFIAPGLGITRRFVGEEAPGSLTQSFNESMARLLPANGIELVVIPRLKSEDNVVSASLVRARIEEGRPESIRELVPRTTYDYICSDRQRSDTETQGNEME